MSQDARYDEEVATQRRASILGLNYVDTREPTKVLYKDLLTVQEMYQKRVVPVEADESNLLFGITTTTSQQTLRELEQRFTDRLTKFAIMSDSGYREYMRLYDPPKKISYQEISFAAKGIQCIKTSFDKFQLIFIRHEGKCSAYYNQFYL